MKQEKFIPKNKLSKKVQKELNNKARKSWNGISPVTKRVQSDKKYSRSKLKTELRREIYA